MKTINQFIKKTALLFSLPLITACSGVKFSEAPVNDKVSSNKCTVTDTNRLTKILFLVDTSGSNVLYTRLNGTQQCFNTDPDFASCVLPTDPNKAFRGGVIQNFLTDHANKTNFHWGFITFADDSAHAMINSNGNDQRPYFSASAGTMQSTINQFYNVEDDYATPYQAALELAKRAIQNDRDLNSTEQPQYVIVLLTDGYPTDYNALNGQLDTGAIQSDINALKNIAPGRVTLSSIYYGHNNPNAINLLSWMSQSGDGQFANVNSGNTSFKIDDVIPGTPVCTN